MRLVQAILFLVLLAFTACAEHRYRWALNHAEIQAQPPLARGDLEQIIRLASRATVQDVVWVHRVSFPEHGREEVLVEATSNTAPATDIVLEKFGSAWKIVSQSQSAEY